jgi:hypothetical protein
MTRNVQGLRSAVVNGLYSNMAQPQPSEPQIRRRRRRRRHYKPVVPFAEQDLEHQNDLGFIQDSERVVQQRAYHADEDKMDNIPTTDLDRVAENERKIREQQERIEIDTYWAVQESKAKAEEERRRQQRCEVAEFQRATEASIADEERRQRQHDEAELQRAMKASIAAEERRQLEEKVLRASEERETLWERQQQQEKDDRVCRTDHTKLADAARQRQEEAETARKAREAHHAEARRQQQLDIADFKRKQEDREEDFHLHALAKIKAKNDAARALELEQAARAANQHRGLLVEKPFQYCLAKEAELLDDALQDLDISDDLKLDRAIAMNLAEADVELPPPNEPRPIVGQPELTQQDIIGYYGPSETESVSDLSLRDDTQMPQATSPSSPHQTRWGSFLLSTPERVIDATRAVVQQPPAQPTISTAQAVQDDGVQSRPISSAWVEQPVEVRTPSHADVDNTPAVSENEARVPPAAALPVDTNIIAPVTRQANGGPDWLTDPSLVGISTPASTAPPSRQSTPAGPSRASSVSRKSLPALPKVVITYAEPPVQQIPQPPAPVPASVVVPEARPTFPAVVHDNRTQHIFNGPVNFNNCTFEQPLTRKPSLLRQTFANRNRLSSQGLSRAFTKANESARPLVENLGDFGRSIISKIRPEGEVYRRNRDPDLIPEDGIEEEVFERPTNSLDLSELESINERARLREMLSVQSIRQDLNLGRGPLRVVNTQIPSPPPTPAQRPVSQQTPPAPTSTENFGGNHQAAPVNEEVLPEESYFRDSGIFTASDLEVRLPTPTPVHQHAGDQHLSQPVAKVSFEALRPPQIRRRPVSIGAPAQTQRVPEIRGHYPVFSQVDHDDTKSLDSMRNNAPSPEGISEELGRWRVHPAIRQDWDQIPPATIPLDQWNTRSVKGLGRGLDGVPAMMPTVPEREGDEKPVPVDRSITPNTRAKIREKDAQKYLRRQV